MPTGTRLVLVAAVVGALLLLAACGGDNDEADREVSQEAFPTEYFPDEDVPIRRQFFTLAWDRDECGIGGQVLDCSYTASGYLEAQDEDETRATLRLSFAQTRVEGGSIECGGLTFDGPFTSDSEDAGVGELTLEGFGSADLVIERDRGAYEQGELTPGDPVCNEKTGIWTGTSGELEGRSGTFTLIFDPMPMLELHE